MKNLLRLAARLLFRNVGVKMEIDYIGTLTPGLIQHTS